MDKLQQLAAEMEAQGYKGGSISRKREWRPTLEKGTLLDEVKWLLDDPVEKHCYKACPTTLQYQTPDGFKHGFRFKAPLK